MNIRHLKLAIVFVFTGLMLALSFQNCGKGFRGGSLDQASNGSLHMILAKAGQEQPSNTSLKINSLGVGAYCDLTNENPVCHLGVAVSYQGMSATDAFCITVTYPDSSGQDVTGIYLPCFSLNGYILPSYDTKGGITGYELFNESLGPNFTTTIPFPWNLPLPAAQILTGHPAVHFPATNVKVQANYLSLADFNAIPGAKLEQNLTPDPLPTFIPASLIVASDIGSSGYGVSCEYGGSEYLPPAPGQSGGPNYDCYFNLNIDGSVGRVVFSASGAPVTDLYCRQQYSLVANQYQSLCSSIVPAQSVTCEGGSSTSDIHFNLLNGNASVTVDSGENFQVAGSLTQYISTHHFCRPPSGSTSTTTTTTTTSTTAASPGPDVTSHPVISFLPSLSTFDYDQNITMTATVSKASVQNVAGINLSNPVSGNPGLSVCEAPGTNAACTSFSDPRAHGFSCLVQPMDPTHYSCTRVSSGQAEGIDGPITVVWKNMGTNETSSANYKISPPLQPVFQLSGPANSSGILSYGSSATICQDEVYSGRIKNLYDDGNAYGCVAVGSTDHHCDQPQYYAQLVTDSDWHFVPAASIPKGTWEASFAKSTLPLGTYYFYARDGLSDPNLKSLAATLTVKAACH